MREIHVNDIIDTVAKLCMDANYYLNTDIMDSFKESVNKEEKPLAKDIINILMENAQLAAKDKIAICQDTGMAVVYVKIGQEVHMEGGLLKDAINKGVAKGYEEGYLRKSVVADPINRVNTKNNTPAVIHMELVEGDKLDIIVAPKGFGSENMSALKMLTPSAGIEGVKNFVIETVKNAGPNPCPPIIVRIGVGGTMDMAAVIAKKALLRPVNEKNTDSYWAGIEDELLKAINELDIGPAGFGGVTTCLGVNINTYATHIAGLPVAVNIGCHVTRHAHAIL